jgi:radical SAM superfamily enzyme YgiQ (UPF0313 family)
MSVSPAQAEREIAGRRWKVLLVSVNLCSTPEPVFPLGLAHLSAALEAAGHPVAWIDLLVDGGRFEEALVASKADLVGLSVRNIDDVLIRRGETFVGHLESLVATVHRKLGCPVVLGGSGFSILPRELLEITGADFGIIGEGETALPELIAALEHKADYSGIAGLVFRGGGGITSNGRHLARAWRQPVAAPEPQYAAEYLRRGGILNVQTQRGCAHRCCYCTYPVIEGARHRRRPVEAVVAEFEQLERLGARYAFVVDSVFNSSERHVVEICEALVRRGLGIRWGCFLRPQGLTAELMRLMARAGLAHIEFGSDSFCDEVLASYQKGFTFQDVRRSTALARAEDLDFCHFVIAGGPGETVNTLQTGFSNSQLLGNPVVLAVPGMRVYPGTDLFARAVSEGQIRPDANLLKPAYYLAPGLSLEQVLAALRGIAAQCPNWVVGDFDPAYDGLVAKLRRRGVSGPLWSYLSAAQRLWGRGE